MKLRLTPRAAVELDDLLSYIASENPVAANRVADRIKNCFDLLCDMPLVGKPSLRPNTREYIVPRLTLLCFKNTSEGLGGWPPKCFRRRKRPDAVPHPPPTNFPAP